MRVPLESVGWPCDRIQDGVGCCVQLLLGAPVRVARRVPVMRVPMKVSEGFTGIKGLGFGATA